MDRAEYRRAAHEYFVARARSGVLGEQRHRVQMLGRARLPDDGDGARTRPRVDPPVKPVSDLLRGALRTVLVGGPGAGKTTSLLLHAAALAAADDGPLPVFVSLRELDGKYEDLERLIAESMRRVRDEPGDLRDGAWVLLLDGVNECATTGDPFRRLIDNHPQVPMIFTSREPATRLGPTIDLLPLAPADRDALIAAWMPGPATALKDRLAHDRRLDELSRTPLLLALLCDATRDGLAPKGTRVALVRASVACHARRYADKFGADAYEPARVDAWLAALAFAALARGALQIADLEAEAVLRAAPGAPSDPRMLLRHLVTFHLLARNAPGVVEFVHPLIHEFYAAHHLRAAPLPGRRTLIREYINRAAWTEPLRLFAEECHDPAVAASLVDAARDVDEILAARLAGAFPAPLQGPLMRRLDRDDDTPGSRLTRAIAVGTTAAADDLQRLAVDPDPDVRFQVADCLGELLDPRFAMINAGLLTDSSLSVVNAAAQNLQRQPAPATALIAALDRADLWACRPPYALPLLVEALLASDDPAAATRACSLALDYLASDDPDARHDQPYSSVHGALFSAKTSITVHRALANLLGAVPERAASTLFQMLARGPEDVDLEPALSALPGERRRELVEWSLAYPGRFAVPDERLLAAIQQRFNPFNLGLHNRLFTAAVERRCHGLVGWLARLLADDERVGDWYVGGEVLAPLLALDALATRDAATRALASDVPYVRRDVAAALCHHCAPTLAELRSRAVALAHDDVKLACRLITSNDLGLVAEFLDVALATPGHARVLVAFWRRHDVAPFIAHLREKQGHEPLFWPQQMPAPLRSLVARSLLSPADPDLTERFLDSHLWRDMYTLVVPYLTGIVDTGDHDAVARAMRRLSAVDWRVPLPTFIRLIADGHAVYWLRPELDDDTLFIALRPLLRHADPNVRRTALASLHATPSNHLEAFIELLEDPALTRPVASRLVTARVFAVFPDLLRRLGLVVMQGSDDPPEPEESTDPWDRESIAWHTFERAITDAPLTVIAECVAILAARDDPAWVRPFVQLFLRAPTFRHHTRVIACVRARDPYEADQAFTALLTTSTTADELVLLDGCHDDPDLPRLLVANAFADVAPPTAAPLVLARLVRLVESPDPEHEVIRHSLAASWLRLLAQVGAAEHGLRLTELARRAGDVWLAQALYRTAGEIQQRTGIYDPRHTTMHRPWTLLHLSDLHFSAHDQPERWYSALAEDLRRELALDRLDAVVLSGDIVDRARAVGYSAAERFIAAICDEFHVPRDGVVIVPGNHDVDRSIADPVIRRLPKRGKPQLNAFEVDGRKYAITDRATYDQRLAAFAGFFARVLGRDYPLDPCDQATLWHWPKLEVIILGLSSVGENDGVRPGHATIDDTALCRALERLRRDDHRDWLKIAVVHHPLHSPGEDRLRDSQFLDRLAVAGFSLLLHGHVHQADSALVRYDRTARGRRIEVVGAGTFGARSSELPTGYPWQYNLLRFDGGEVRVHTRRREADNTSWKPHACWTTGPGEPPQAWYSLDLVGT